jgi:hypothetical protein
MESISVGQASAGPLELYSELDRWFDAIDHKRIGSGRSSWIAEVVGIHADGEDLWVQVSPTERPGSTVVLRVAVHSPSEGVTAALACSCRWPITALQVIDFRRAS